VPGWLRATRLYGCGITAHLFTLPDADRPDLPGWLGPGAPRTPRSVALSPP